MKLKIERITLIPYLNVNFYLPLRQFISDSGNILFFGSVN